jgi:exportin-1
MFRNITLKCLTEIVSINVATYHDKFLTLFSMAMVKLKQMLPFNINLREAYRNGSSDEQNFIQNLSIFLSTFLREHGNLVEKQAAGECAQLPRAHF